MRICDLSDKRVAIWGLGQEGQAILRVLREQLSSLAVLDDKTLSEAEKSSLGVRVIDGKQARQRLHEFDVIIKSPGISPYCAEIEKAKAVGVVFTSATRLWFADNQQAKTICVTGTKGKSTTSSLITHLLQHCGYDVALAGNIGTPLWEVVQNPSPGIWVIEMSSYQTSDFDGSPTIAVLLNLFPEHLDWHGSVERYYRDKIHLLETANTTIVHSAYRDRCPPCSFLFCDQQGVHHHDGYIWNGQTRWLARDKIALRGEHNLDNVCAALTVMHCLDIPLDRCLPALSSFCGLPHRLYCLGERDGIFYIDDSISTTPQSAMAAIKAYQPRPISLLVGGFDRGLDWGSLARFLTNGAVHAVITMPDSGEQIAAALRELPDAPDLYQTQGLHQAVEVARKATPLGGVVLLSPAAPSYGHFANFRERGQAFAKFAGFVE